MFDFFGEAFMNNIFFLEIEYKLSEKFFNIYKNYYEIKFYSGKFFFLSMRLKLFLRPFFPSLADHEIEDW